MRVIALLPVVTGCVLGGGPVVGIGEHGWFGGVEASGGGGFLLPQATIGYQTRHHLLYGRVDETIDPNIFLTHRLPFGGRIGGGIGVDVTEGEVAGVAAVGATATIEFRTSGNCNRWRPAGGVEVQLRYATEWQFALVPRVEYATQVCE